MMDQCLNCNKENLKDLLKESIRLQTFYMLLCSTKRTRANLQQGEVREEKELILLQLMIQSLERIKEKLKKNEDCKSEGKIRERVLKECLCTAIEKLLHLKQEIDCLKQTEAAKRPPKREPYKRRSNYFGYISNKKTPTNQASAEKSTPAKSLKGEPKNSVESDLQPRKSNDSTKKIPTNQYTAKKSTTDSEEQPGNQQNEQKENYFKRIFRKSRKQESSSDRSLSVQFSEKAEDSENTDEKRLRKKRRTRAGFSKEIQNLSFQRDELFRKKCLHTSNRSSSSRENILECTTTGCSNSKTQNKENNKRAQRSSSISNEEESYSSGTTLKSVCEYYELDILKKRRQDKSQRECLKSDSSCGQNISKKDITMASNQKTTSDNCELHYGNAKLISNHESTPLMKRQSGGGLSSFLGKRDIELSRTTLINPNVESLSEDYQLNLNTEQKISEPFNSKEEKIFSEQSCQCQCPSDGGLLSDISLTSVFKNMLVILRPDLMSKEKPRKRKCTTINNRQTEDRENYTVAGHPFCENDSQPAVVNYISPENWYRLKKRLKIPKFPKPLPKNFNLNTSLCEDAEIVRCRAIKDRRNLKAWREQRRRLKDEIRKMALLKSLRFKPNSDYVDADAMDQMIDGDFPNKVVLGNKSSNTQQTETSGGKVTNMSTEQAPYVDCKEQNSKDNLELPNYCQCRCAICERLSQKIQRDNERNKERASSLRKELRSYGRTSSSENIKCGLCGNNSCPYSKIEQNYQIMQYNISLRAEDLKPKQSTSNSNSTRIDRSVNKNLEPGMYLYVLGNVPVDDQLKDKIIRVLDDVNEQQNNQRELAGYSSAKKNLHMEELKASRHFKDIFDTTLTFLHVHPMKKSNELSKKYRKKLNLENSEDAPEEEKKFKVRKQAGSMLKKEKSLLHEDDCFLENIDSCYREQVREKFKVKQRVKFSR